MKEVFAVFKSESFSGKTGTCNMIVGFGLELHKHCSEAIFFDIFLFSILMNNKI